MTAPTGLRYSMLMVMSELYDMTVQKEIVHSVLFNKRVRHPSELLVLLTPPVYENSFLCLSKFVSSLYVNCPFSLFSCVDVILEPFHVRNASNSKWSFQDNLEVFVDSDSSKNYFETLLSSHFNAYRYRLKSFSFPHKTRQSGSQSLIHPCKHVCLGGTFDRLHNGHKAFLSAGLLFAESSLLIGVTGDASELIKRKILFEMIQPYSERTQKLQDFANLVRPSIPINVVELLDPFGPAITEAYLDGIVVSQETMKGADAINNRRVAKNMSELSIHAVPLVEDQLDSSPRASNFVRDLKKHSSSSLRFDDLGREQQKPLRKYVKTEPYIIGLTGGTCSGKSTIAAELEGLGAAVVDCDKLGHQCYERGTKVFDRLVSEFGEIIISGDGSIDRKKLGGIVFTDKDKLEKLNRIVWPEIASLAQQKIAFFHKAGVSVIVLEAAVLLEAGWDEFVHEIWTAIVTPDVAVDRLMRRNNLSKEQAELRLLSQLSNSDRVARSNVVLSTQWTDEWKDQITRAWTLLKNERLSESECQ